MLKNRQEIVEKLADMILELEIERNRFEVEIYLYVDEDGNGSLEFFQNPGGNSWRDDDHYVIYTCREFCSGDSAVINEYELDDIFDVLGIGRNELMARAAKHFGYDEEYMDDSNIYSYIEEEDELMQKIIDDYDDNLRENTADYLDAAERAMEEYEYHMKMLEEVEEEQKKMQW